MYKVTYVYHFKYSHVLYGTIIYIGLFIGYDKYVIS